MPLEKAYIETIEGAPKRIPVLFNPAEYSLERANAYKSTPVPGLGGPLIQFINGDAATLSMDLFFDDLTDPGGSPDDTASGPDKGAPKSVLDRIEEITSLLDIDRGLHAPPPVMFVWGRALRFRAVLEKVSRKATLFRPDGTPARATLSVSFREYRPMVRQPPGPLRLESADKTKRRQISAAESIWLIADKEYGDPRAWRVIAEASDLDDPRALRPGDWLRLPPLEDHHGFRRAV